MQGHVCECVISYEPNDLSWKKYLINQMKKMKKKNCE